VASRFVHRTGRAIRAAGHPSLGGGLPARASGNGPGTEREDGCDGSEATDESHRLLGWRTSSVMSNRYTRPGQRLIRA
jgi:hypothetical protein